MKKFEEGVFSDLRNLKPGVDASLEEPKVRFFFFNMSHCVFFLLSFSISLPFWICSSNIKPSALRKNKRSSTGSPFPTTVFSSMHSSVTSNVRKWASSLPHSS